MANNEIPSSDILARLDICSMEPLQMTIVDKEDDVEDFNDDDIDIEMNKQVSLEELSPLRARLNYD
jgi:hypothetical protein